MLLTVVYKQAEYWCLRKDIWITHNYLFISCSRQGYVETTVNERFAYGICECGGGKKLQLIWITHGEAVDDNVSL